MLHRPQPTCVPSLSRIRLPGPCAWILVVSWYTEPARVGKGGTQMPICGEQEHGSGGKVRGVNPLHQLVHRASTCGEGQHSDTDLRCGSIWALVRERARSANPCETCACPAPSVASLPRTSIFSHPALSPGLTQTQSAGACWCRRAPPCIALQVQSRRTVRFPPPLASLPQYPTPQPALTHLA